jgi:glycerophosphoryl diester phosphodiesterase
VEIIAHRGLSGRHPESTRAAYTAAIELARAAGRPIELECDTHFSADGELIVLHDLGLRRTAGREVDAAALTLAELREVDFGSWKAADPTVDERALITLPELFDLVHVARDEGVDVGLAVETKHPNPAGLAVDQAVLELMTEHGWTGADAPVRVISFHLPSVEFWADRLPHLRRTLLVEVELGRWSSGELPYGTDTIGLDLNVLRTDPDFARRVREQGNSLHVWTVNGAADLTWCLELGATGLTTDYADLAIELTGTRVS